MRLCFTPRAERDLESIGDLIAQDSPARTLSFIRDLRLQCLRIARHPAPYRLRTELGAGVRACAHGHYLIVFEDVDGMLTIIRVLHGARNLVSLFEPD